MERTSTPRSVLRVAVLILLLVLSQVVWAQTPAPTWMQLSPTGVPPSARGTHSAVFDPGTNRMTVFAGIAGGVVIDEVWALSNANGLGGTPTWTQLAPTGGAPGARSYHSAVYDPATNRMTVFGGRTPPPSGVLLNDVWVLSNANGLGGVPTWTQLVPTGGPPSGREAHSAVYDPATNRMTVFGGRMDLAHGNDVWVLSNANGLGGAPTWMQLAPTGGPTGRSFHSAVYHPATNRMTVFGGFSASPLNEVWVLSNANGLGGAPTWTQLAPTGGPPSARFKHRTVSDPATNRMTVFGGALITNVSLNDVWVLSNANGLGGSPTWTQLAPTGGPPSPRDDHSTVYDPATNRMTTFGGESNSLNIFGFLTGHLLNDVWVLTNANGVTNQPPSASAGGPYVAECSSPSGAMVTLTGSGSDPDNDPLTFTWTGPFGTLTGQSVSAGMPLGTNTVTLTVDDGHGGTATSTASVTVGDTTAPTISVSLSPNVLSPADHRIVQVTATVQASDACTAAPSVRLDILTSTEPDSGAGPGDVSGDIQDATIGADDRAFSLRAEGYGGGVNLPGIRRVYKLAYRATDAVGNSAGAVGQVTVPNALPVANAGADQRVECTGIRGAAVALNGSASSDADGDPLTYTWTLPLGATATGALITRDLPLGTHTITLTVDDGVGGRASDTVVVVVGDTTAPTVSVSLAPIQLWPPDHRMVPITASIQVSDTCDSGPSVELVSITSNEPDAGLGDGDLPGDIQGASFGTDDRSFSLRAERSWTGSGRLYTATYRARDAQGNTVLRTVQVSVPLGMAVTVDITPGSFPNNINLAIPKGFLSVAILTTPTFNAATVAVSSVSFAGAAPAGSALNDVDADGDLDLVLRFPVPNLQLDCTSTLVRLTGLTTTGTPIQGTDSVRIRRDKNGQLCP